MRLDRPTPASRTRGQAMVEFALVAPILFLVLFGTMEMGYLVFTNHEVANGTREAARYASVRAKTGVSGSQLASHIDDMTSGLNSGALTVGSPTWTVAEGNDPAIADAGDSVTVSVSYTYTPLISFVLGTGSIQLEHEVTVLVHH